MTNTMTSTAAQVQSTAIDVPHVNTVIVTGTVSTVGGSQLRETAHGDVLTFDIATVLADGTMTVPVNVPDTAAGWFGAQAGTFEGATVTVHGSVRRRFFRTGGQTVSRTEIVADRVVTFPNVARTS